MRLPATTASPPAPANAATVQVAVADPPIVAQWAEDAYTVAEGEDATAAALTLKTAAGVPKPRVDYKVKVFTTNNTAVDGDDFTAVSGDLTVRPGAVLEFVVSLDRVRHAPVRVD